MERGEHPSPVVRAFGEAAERVFGGAFAEEYRREFPGVERVVSSERVWSHVERLAAPSWGYLMGPGRPIQDLRARG